MIARAVRVAYQGEPGAFSEAAIAAFVRNIEDCADNRTRFAIVARDGIDAP